MKTRVITSIVGIALLTTLLIFYNTIYFNIVILLVTLIAIHEIYNAFQFGKNSIHIFLGFIPITSLVLMADYMGPRIWMQPVGYLTILFIALCTIINFNTVNFAKLSGMTVFSGIVVFCFYSLIRLKSLLPSSQYGADAVYFVILILSFAWGGDTTAYFVGRAFGKRKLAPVVSPHKTVEGAIGGVIGSMVLGIIVTLIYVQGFGWIEAFDSVRFLYYPVLALLGACASLLGIVGDLFASAVKRQCGIKDYGTIFPGHGGVLDRFDSVMFVAPLVVLVVRTAFYYFAV